MTQGVLVQKAKEALRGGLSFPGDKSLSHRAIIFGSLADGVSEFSNVLAGEDCVCTRRAFEAMGVPIQAQSPTRLTIGGRGLRGLREPKEDLYLGNSGTSMRLLLGLLSGQTFKAVLTGDPSLSGRPMRRVTGFLKQMGADVQGRDEANFAPLTVRGQTLSAIDARLPISSAQVKSAILLAGLYAQGRTSVTEPEKSRDHTERFLRYFGASIKEDGLKVSVEGGQTLQARSFAIAGDISSAAFFMAAAVLVPGSEILFKDVLWNPTRTGICDTLKGMGVVFEKTELCENKGPEVTADFCLRAGASLKPFDIRKDQLPALIDEIPILMVLATQADGASVIHEAGELRVKETDRIESMTANLRKMGANIRVEGNTITIQGKTPLRGCEADSFKDHRTAMSMIIAGLIAEGSTRVNDIECINTSFPTFFELLNSIGGSVVRLK